MKKNKNLKVSIVMGSQSDYKIMQLAEKTLKKIGVSFETKIISAHRTPKRMYDYALKAENNNIAVIIAGAGGSAHLPGMISALTSIPVLGVPIESKKLKGLDSLLSIAQMPKGIPVGTLAIGEDGAINAALLAASIIANQNSSIKLKLKNWRSSQTKSVKKNPK
ncbi:5-(carboxyamino)imidazole ribonucleotide mutase [Pelagibacterales bacterium SAG-MED07]|jgi:5-(carboxyamino)imidazole ribonucleotide mutase|nr:5-(carboxyamino)imidazole ribonucleotide mutase [Pelagibacterales bacterium SAG-MED07]MBD1169849.1 5-(carboxyamino)imidazole ribonucleotide mutase [Pelagibacterales bacterium SAG-MED08]PDH18847.1 MAG: 5-(carboxyamino)imidazole ribonucleotide mutase [Pelagibacterales bacterium MED-G39]|tara:strand:+ start:53 stop:544 length:492 start_codon:yes stop_codon:yes gene_type:complete